MAFSQELNKWCLEMEGRVTKLEVAYGAINSNIKLLMGLMFANISLMGAILGAVLLH